ncbi:MAG: terpene cyclase/mutase family protein, partial [Oscillospiraceae bacterium]|nr:terpene cyclase/mutase family protein [Oscillospiraceae bacterium]
MAIQYTAADSGDANVKFKTILGTWAVDSTEKSHVSGAIDTTWSSTTDICGAIISNVADGYILSGWKITIGSDSTTYSKDIHGNVFQPDYSFACWYGDAGNQWIHGGSHLGGVIVCYDPGADVIVEPIFDTAGSQYKLTALVMEGQSAYGSVTATDELSNIWKLTAVPDIEYALKHWECAEGLDITDDSAFQVVPDTDWTTKAITVTIDQDMTYRAVFEPMRVWLDVEDTWLFHDLYIEPYRNMRQVTIPGVSNYIKPEALVGPDTFLGAHAISWPDGTHYKPQPGQTARFEVSWKITGDLRLSGLQNWGGTTEEYAEYAVPGQYGGHYMSIAVYPCGEAEARAGTVEPILDLTDVVLYSEAGRFGDPTFYHILTPEYFSRKHFRHCLYFEMPDAEYLTVRFELSGIEPVYQTFDGIPKIPEINELRDEFRTLENLKWRALIDIALQEAYDDITLRGKPVAETVAKARTMIEGYINGTNAEYITVSFGGGSMLVRVPDKISQETAMRAALEQVYPSEKGFWYLDINNNVFGYWVNGYGGRLFTESELTSGYLETEIVTPSKTFSAGEPLPRSGIISGRQSGRLQYTVNGFYANLGISSWRCSYGDKITWGPSNMDGLAAETGWATETDWLSSGWGEGGNPVWGLAPDFTGDADVIKALALCEAITSSSTEADVIAARAAYNAMRWWNSAYAQHLFRTFDPYKSAYEKLIAAEAELGIVDPLPEVTYTQALNGALDTIAATTPGVGSVNGEWAAFALARSGKMGSSFESAYLTALDTALANNAGGTTSKTDLERIILALTSLGIDASDYKGADGGGVSQDLVARMDALTFGTVNGDIYALLALNSKPYDSDKRGTITTSYNSNYEEIETITGYIFDILDIQLGDGAWALAGTIGDVDTTAMAIQALAPYYQTSATVHAAVDDALDWLQSQQNDKGGFAGFGGSVENSTESSAQVIVALTALGIDPTSWEKPGGWNPLMAMLYNYNEDNGWFGKENNTQRD